GLAAHWSEQKGRQMTAVRLRWRPRAWRGVTGFRIAVAGGGGLALLARPGLVMAAALLARAAMPLMAALLAMAAMLAVLRRTVGCGRFGARRCIGPADALADQLLDGGDRLAVDGADDSDGDAGLAGAAGAADAV